ncbi:hypothetical protein JXB41_00390 [Candidatus Woesearchaeota archaeon]|nr:hypothetical protein [Candidatus Woesearchaeota archaeon]
MPYKCNKCKKQWMHKIGKCIFCDGELHEIIPENLEVMHCIEVNIPSKQHPEVPYYVLQVKDKSGNIYFRKSKTQKKPGEKWA